MVAATSQVDPDERGLDMHTAGAPVMTVSVSRTFRLTDTGRGVRLMPVFHI